MNQQKQIETVDPALVYRCWLNGLYDRALKDCKRKERLIKRMKEKHAGEAWLKRWLVKQILAKSKTTLKYELLVIDILEIKYHIS